MSGLSLQQRIARLGWTPEQYHEQRRAAYRKATDALEASNLAEQDDLADRNGARNASWRVLSLNPDGTATAEADWQRSRPSAEPG